MVNTHQHGKQQTSSKLSRLPLEKRHHWVKTGLCFIFIILQLLFINQLTYAATNIYRSVGPGNNLALAMSDISSTLSIAGSMATFTTALPVHVGVGDAIQYDIDGDGSIDAIAFIHSRSDSNRVTVANANGGMPQSTNNTSDWQIYRAYTSLADAESGTVNPGLDTAVQSFESWSDGQDLVASDQIWNIACYNDDVDNVSVTINDWTTGPNNYLVIFTPVLQSEVGVSQRHNGTWTAAGYRIMADPVGTWAGVVFILDDHVRIYGLQVEAQGADDDTDGITVDGNQVASSGEILIAHNIVRKDGMNSNLAMGIGAWGHSVAVGNNPTVRIWNNIVYNFNGTSNFGIFVGYYCSSTMYVYNNTVVNCTNGYVVDGNNATPNYVLKNNIAQNCTRGYWERSGGSFNSVLSDFNISNNSNETTNISPSYLPGLQRTIMFEGVEDFHLSSTDTTAIDEGQDLSLDTHSPFTLDIDLQLRPLGDAWDIGADESELTISTPVPTPSPLDTPTPIMINATATNTPISSSRDVSDVIISQNVLRPGTNQAVHIELNLDYRQRIIIAIYNRR